MRAAILTEYNEPLTIEEVATPPIGAREVMLHIDASGVCHSDLSFAKGNVPLPPPVILGHEGAGTVLAVGEDVSRVEVGDRVISSFTPSCGNCFFCLRDQSFLCETMGSHMMVPKGTRADGSTVFGATGLGTFADEMIVDESMLVKVETDLPADQLALIGCGITTGVGAALNTAQVEPGATVTVIGCGGVGQSVIQGARIAGASRIFAVDPVEMKRKTAEQFGATDLIDPAAGDPVEQIQAATSGRGTDYAFEVIGLPDTILQAWNVARAGGTAVVVGMSRFDDTVTFPAMGLFGGNKALLGCLYGSANVRRDFPRFVHLVETGRLDIGSMVSRHIQLDEVNDAFRAMEAGEVIRSVIT
jgi:S-(hydroxymethyl)glutathione dehydrogenase / alcohol dehydrogenase